MTTIRRNRFNELFGLVILALTVLTSCSNTAERESRIVLGQAMAVLNAPIFVTTRKTLWEEQSLQMKIRPFVAGRLALDALLSGDVDVATIADTPMAYALFTHNHLRIVGTVMESPRDIKILARKDSGIQTPSDLKGKRVGVSFGTTSEFYAFRFLSAIDLSPSDVQLINIKAQDMVAALSNGNIDAYVSWEPHVQNGIRQLGDQVIVLRNSEIYTETWNLVTTQKFFKERPEAIRRILKAVIRGVDLMQANPDEAIDITAKELGMKREVLEAIWKDYDFTVSLSNKLLTSLQAQGEWIKNTKGEGNDRPLPDYHQAIFPQPLRALSPNAVTLK